MRGRGAFQVAQMARREPWVVELCNHLRSAIDILEQLALDPTALKATPQPVSQVEMGQTAEPEKLAYSVREVSTLLDIGPNTIYKAVNDRTLPSVKFGSRILIPSKGFRDWIGSPPIPHRTYRLRSAIRPVDTSRG